MFVAVHESECGFNWLKKKLSREAPFDVELFLLFAAESDYKVMALGEL